MAISYQAAILLVNKADTATIIASSQVAEAPVSRVKSPHIVTKWRSSAEPASLLLDFGEPVSIDTVAAIGLTATAARCRVSNNSDGSEPLYDSEEGPVDQTFNQAVWLIETPVTARYVLIELVHASLEYCEAGRVVAGERETFHFNFVRGFTVRYPDPSRVEESAGGQTIIDPRPSYRVMEPTFDFVSEEDAAGFIRSVNMSGVKSDVLFISKPAGGDLAHDTIWGLNRAEPAIVQVQDDIYSVKYTIQERR